MFMRQLGDLAAFDIDNPSGRFMLNLSRRADRFIAMRLQACIVCRGAKGGAHLSSPITFSLKMFSVPHLTSPSPTLLLICPTQAASILENSIKDCK